MKLADPAAEVSRIRREREAQALRGLTYGYVAGWFVLVALVEVFR